MNYKRKYKKEILNKLTPQDKSDELINKLNLNNVPKEKKMKKGLAIATGALALSVIVGVGTYVVIDHTQVKEATSVVTLSVNPSVRFVLDKKNNVVAVSGENDEGKMIIAEEEIVGKSIDEAIELVLTIENETGYLVSGNVVKDTDNNISVSITVDSKKVKEALENKINSTVTTVCDKLNVNETISYVEGYTRIQLEELAVRCDPTLKDKVQDMTYEQLINVVKLYSLETASLYSESLEEFYNDFKEYEIKFANAEFTNNVIDGLNSIIINTIYKPVYDSLTIFKDRLNDAYYNNFIKEGCSYQKALESLKEAKQEVLSFKNEISKLEDSTTKTELLKELDAKEEVLTTCETILEAQKSTCEASINSVKGQIDTALTTLDSAIENLKSMSNEVKETLNNKAQELENSMNEFKDNLFTSFENEYKDDIAAAKEKVLAYKQSLKDSINNTTTNN